MPIKHTISIQKARNMEFVDWLPHTKKQVVKFTSCILVLLLLLCLGQSYARGDRPEAQVAADAQENGAFLEDTVGDHDPG